MNPELEKLVLAYEAFSVSQGKEGEALLNTFESLVDDAMRRCPPGLVRETFRKLIIRQHGKWLSKQKNPTTLPPRA